ncbi:11196_t:CDS:2 [Gigaspora margarita]|uniref:11196_t:CDS:1 n=1 Tax=Gigaspora margarita TaxID=4874 RepID=A0ABN7V0A0_GIGMA|nr:11196_t:CDS:2 [Gigaspora margarita]
MDYALLPIAKEEKRPPKRFKSSKKEVMKPPAGKVRRIHLFPTQEERMKLRKWIGTARWTYNRCLIAVKEEETPYDIWDEAINDLLKGYTSNFATKHENFKMKFCSKKDSQQSIAILSKHWGRSGRSRGEFLFLHKMNSAESLPKQLGYDSHLVMNRLGEFYLCIPELLKIRAKNQGPLFLENQEKGGSGVIALDPDVRTFMTGYDPSGMAIEWGKNDVNRIYRLCHIYDRLQSKQDMIHGKGNKCKRYRLRRVMLRIHKRIRCLVHECHCKLTKWLCENYCAIILPEFCAQRMIRHGQQCIAHEHPWCRIILCTEEYTSKTCGFCSYIHHKLGGSKKFCCPKCKMELDRDINGARNILLRYLTKKESV